jgi:hypothetical protein
MILLAIVLAVLAPNGLERWLLHLADGRVQRGVARETPDGFEVQREGRWEPVARREVVRSTRESEVLASLAAKSREAATDPAREVEVARWALGEGLLPESIAELDLVLGRDPDFAPARELVAAAPLALTLPATAERTMGARLVLFGARAKPAYRELAAARLSALPAEESGREIARGLVSPSPKVRAFSAFAARRIDPRPQADVLVRRAVLDPAEPVRLEAARALKAADDETLARRVEAALELDDARLRTFAAASLAEMGYRSSVPALVDRLSALQKGSHPGGTRGYIRVGSQVAYVQDFNPQIAQAASIFAPIVNTVDDVTQLDVRVGGTSVQEVPLEGPVLCRALARITRENGPEKPEEWLAWWSRRESVHSGTGEGR